jgi:hypothetical protein
MREARIGGTHRRDQRLDDLGLHPIREVPLARDIGEPTPAIGNFLILGERIEGEREEPHVLAKRRRQRFRCRLAPLLGRIQQHIERRLDGEPLALDLESQARNCLVEQPVPSRIARH